MSLSMKPATARDPRPYSHPGHTAPLAESLPTESASTTVWRHVTGPVQSIAACFHGI